MCGLSAERHGCHLVAGYEIGGHISGAWEEGHRLLCHRRFHVCFPGFRRNFLARSPMTLDDLQLLPVKEAVRGRVQSNLLITHLVSSVSQIILWTGLRWTLIFVSRLARSDTAGHRPAGRLRLSLGGRLRLSLGGRLRLTLGGTPRLSLGGRLGLTLGGTPRLTLGGRLGLTLGGTPRLTLGARLQTARLTSSARATVKGWTNRTPTPFVWVVFTFVSSLVLPIFALALALAFAFIFGSATFVTAMEAL